MPTSEKPLVERIARVLAGAAHSSNAEGSDPSAGEKVDKVWPQHVNQALAVLHTMREPDEQMAASGDPENWSRMVETAISSWEKRDLPHPNVKRPPGRPDGLSIA